MKFRAIARLTATLAFVAATCGTAQAAATYCSSATGAAPLATTDVTFNTVKANDCFGVVDLQNQDPSTIKDYANNNGLWTPDPWTFITRDDNKTGNSGVGTLGGYSFTISADNSSNGNPPSTWYLTVTGSPMPFTMDFIVYLHAGSNSAYYFFDDRQINTSNSGTFTIAFTNNGGENPALSGLTILARDIGNTVPEPSILGLLGLGLVGLAFSRRRKQ
jgi:hypothetical protein